MATPDIEVVEISLLSGRSDRPSMTFTPGTPSPTLSLGSAGQWAISGEGVGPVHVFVTFDGQSVHVAAAVANLPVAMAGAPIGTGWSKAPIPCELRFGGACVILRRTSRPGSFTQEEATVHDGGALWHAAQLAAQASQAPPQMASQIPSVRPAAGMPAEPTQILAPQHQAYTPAAAPPMDLSATTPLADAQKFRDAVANASAPRPLADSSPSTERQPNAPYPPPSPPPPEPLGDLEKTKIAPHPPRPPLGAPGLTAGLAGERPPPAAAMPGPVMGGAPPASIQEAKPLNYWQAASPVKKATLVLMPFALVMAFLMLRDDPPPPPRVAAAKHAALDGGALATIGANDGGVTLTFLDASTATASANTTSTADGGVATTDALDAAPDPNANARQDSNAVAPKVTPLSGSKRTPERAALDTVAAGSFDDAAKRYEALAASHADDPSYKEAARILHEKAGN